MSHVNYETRAEADRAIEKYGNNLAQIRKLEDDNRVLKGLFETWAANHPGEAFDAQDTMSGRTEHYAFRLAKGTPSLTRIRNVSEAEVVKRLEGDEEMRGYVKTTYDAAALKRDFIRKSRQIEAFGLTFTSPKAHLVVESAEEAE